VGEIRLTPLAEQDLRDIWQHGAETLGPVQAERYFDTLYATFELIVDFPKIARVRTTFTPPCAPASLSKSCYHL
jgi:toxin ParE1/3/4